MEGAGRRIEDRQTARLPGSIIGASWTVQQNRVLSWSGATNSRLAPVWAHNMGRM